MGNTKFSRGRTDNQIEKDFEECCSLLAQGKTWAEVHYIISGLRKYSVTLGALKRSYSKKLQKTAEVMSVENEKERIIEDLDAIMLKCMIQFNESIGEQSSIREQGWTDDNGKIKKPFKVITKMKSHGASKYLDVYLKALEKKTKLKDLEKNAQLDINLFLQNHDIDEGGNTEMKPIRSEKDAKKFGESI